MKYTIYNTTLGNIVRRVSINGNINDQLKSGESYIEGDYDDSKYYINNDEVIPITPSPGLYYTFDWNTKTWILNYSVAANDVKTKRNNILYSSDWTQIPNNPLTTEKQQEWATYRQQLRDVTAQPGYPYNVVWPTPPTN